MNRKHGLPEGLVLTCTSHSVSPDTLAAEVQGPGVRSTYEEFITVG